MSAFPSDRFAASIAHLLNESEASVCRIDIGLLYAELLRRLAKTYKDSLLGHAAYAARMTSDEAAERYLAATLQRSLWLSNNAPVSVAHKLLLAMCQRGFVPSLTMARSTKADDAVAPLASGDLKEIFASLGKCSFDTESGNPARAIQGRDGPLYLSAGNLRQQVPEQISIWNAIECSPKKLKKLEGGEPFNRFCGVVIDALRTANRPFLEVIGVGRRLCPFDWLDTVSINQLRSVRRFLQVVGDRGDTLDGWAAAWRSAPVAGFKTVQEFWSSDFGRALRDGPSQLLSIESDEDIADASPEVLGGEDFARELAGLRKAGAISETEEFVLTELYRGETLDELAAEGRVQQLLRQRKLTMPAFVIDLQRRLESFHNSQSGLQRHG